MTTASIPEMLTATRYSYADADRLAGVSRGTSKRWIEGYQHAGAGETLLQPPVSRASQHQPGGVSFADLVEIAAIAGLRAHGFPVSTVRRIVENCEEQFATSYPLSTLRFKVGGRDVFVDDGSTLHDVLRHKGALAWDDVLGPFLETLDYHEAFAVRWWPAGRSGHVVIDPAVGYGLPVIAGSGVRTEIIRERERAGDSWEQIARDFNISRSDVARAVEFEQLRAA